MLSGIAASKALLNSGEQVTQDRLHVACAGGGESLSAE